MRLPASTILDGPDIAIVGRTVDGVTEAVVVPSGMYGPAAGVLIYAGAVADRRGATVHHHSWSQEPPTPFDLQIGPDGSWPPSAVPG